ncbi:MAG TPA: carboxypeptidase regulatory-like domain-containing protein [Thermoanaerobaculia bacterium]|nr:carboxypeptidase regulatory-like domain-containing protein [Thermoanaerobaculia bacterium]
MPALLVAQPIRVSGRVMAPNGRDGLPGARVELRQAWEGYAEAVRRLRGETVPPLATARADAEGFFEIAAPETGAYRLRASADGYVSVEHPLIPLMEDTDLEPAWLQSAKSPDWPDEIRLGAFRGWRPADDGALETGARLRLEVRGGDGKPVPDALVRQRSSPASLTGPDGRVEVALPAGDEPLTVEGRDGAWAEVTAPPRAQTGVVSVHLAPPRVLTGRVLQAASSAPLANALVWAGSRPLGAPVRAGTDGAFRLTLSTSEEVSLQAAAPAYLPSESRFVPKTAVEPTVLRLEAASRISGQVVDESSRPVSRASLTVGSRAATVTATSRADGRFLFSGLRPQESYEIQASHPGFTRATLKARAPGPGQTAPPVRIVLGAGVTVFGRVVKESGKPVAGAKLLLTGGPREMDTWLQETADGEGRFELRALEPESFILRVQAADLAPVRRTFVISAESKSKRIDLGAIELAAGAVLAGRVTDSRGMPIAAASVWRSLGELSGPEWLPDRHGLDEPDGKTAPDGSFRLTGLPLAAPIHLRVEHEGYVPLAVPDVEVPVREPLHLEMKPARSLAGRVVDADGGPVAGAALTRGELNLESGQGSLNLGLTLGEGQPSARTDSQGAFRITGLEPGTVDLRVQARGYATRTVHGIPIPQDQDREGLEIVLQRGVLLAVKVLSPEGAPASDSMVRAESENQSFTSLADLDSMRGMFGSTDERGTCLIEVVRPGNYRIVASIAGESVAKLVQAGEGTTPVELRFPAGAEVSGRVTDSQGQGVGRVLLALGTEPESSMPQQSAWSGEDGGFVLRHVPDGAFRLTAQGQGLVQSGGPREVVVTGADVRGLDVRVEPQTGSTLTGHLLGLAAEEMPGSEVHASGPADFETATVEPDGRYEMKGLQPGDWHVTALTASRRQSEQSVQIRAGDTERVLDFDFGQGFTLSGRVLLDGTPLSGAAVMVGSEKAGSQSAQTDFAGRFKVRDLAAGSYVVFVLATRGITGYGQPVDVAGDTEVTLDVPTGVLRGRVVSAATGEPIPGAAVTIRNPGGEPPPLLSMALVRSSEEGLFESRLADGTYQVQVQKDGYAPVEATAEVRSGTGTAMEIRLQPVRP